MIKEYIAYLKDNPKGYWFKSRLFGWGWVPVKWQGWLVILIFLGFLIGLALFLGEEPSETDLAWFFGLLIASIIIFFVICYKTGEKPKWHWGIPEKYKRGTRPE